MRPPPHRGSTHSSVPRSLYPVSAVSPPRATRRDARRARGYTGPRRRGGREHTGRGARIPAPLPRAATGAALAGSGASSPRHRRRPDARPPSPASARHPASCCRLPVHLLPDQRRSDQALAPGARSDPRERAPRSAGTVAPLPSRDAPRTHGTDRGSGLRTVPWRTPPAPLARRRRSHGLSPRGDELLRASRMGDALPRPVRRDSPRGRAPPRHPRAGRRGRA